MNSKTIKEKIKIKGKGIHTSLISTVILHPHQNYIQFYNKKKIVNLSPYAVVDTIGSTNLEIVKTVEHLLCSLFLNKIDNILIEVQGEEIPILDGSIFYFNQFFENNVVELPYRAWHFSVPGFLDFGDTFALPSQSLEIYCFLQDPKTHMKSFFYWNQSSELLPAKTYGYLQDYYILQSLKLGLGSDPYNTNILSIHKPNPKNYELNYHKIIDFLGDLYTTNIPYIKGTFFLYNPNHTINNQVAKRIYEIANKNRRRGVKVC